MVMENSCHVLLIGAGAEEFARTQKVDFEEEAYFYDELRYQQLQEAKKNNVTQLDHSPLNEKKYGAVGAETGFCFKAL